MELTNKNKRMDLPVFDPEAVGQLTSQILSRRTSKPLFKWRLPQQSALNLLAGYYSAEVIDRAGGAPTDCGNINPVFDAPTIEVLTKFARFITSQEPVPGIMLAGTVGNGKSTMMKAFMKATNYLDLVHHNFRYMDDAATGTPFHPDFQMYDARKILDKIKIRESFDTICRIPCLAIDDLGTEATEVVDYGTIKRPLLELLEYRYSRNLFTIVTTNLTPAMFAEHYDVRTADRLKEMFYLITFLHPSYRGRLNSSIPHAGASETRSADANQ